jgi:citrate lyase subunit beta/citryl-CoA lyase
MSVSIRPRRSALYVPGANARALEKAADIPADVLILDLEDAVSPDQKEYARAAVADALPGLIGGRREIVVRINGLDTPWIARDIAAMAVAEPDAILLPKLSSTENLRRARTALAVANAPKSMELWAMIETPLAVLNVHAIAAVAAMPAPALTCFVVGTNDLAADLGARLRPGRAAMLPHIASVLAAARAHGLAALDGTFTDLDDEPGFRRECVQGRDFGFDGKTLVHPRQVATANEEYSPSLDELAWARKVIDAFSRPENADKGAISVDERMVERLHERAARRTLDFHAAIAGMAERPQNA